MTPHTKNPPHQTTLFELNRFTQEVSRLAFLVALSLILVSQPLNGQTTIVKANNTTSLNQGASWVGGVVPAATNIAVWNSTVTGANIVALGTTTNWEGIQILNPGGPVTISNDGSTLTNGLVGDAGLVGINMASASQNLTLSNNLVLNGVQNWNIGPGVSLTLGGNLLRNSGGVARLYLADTNTSLVFLTNGNATLTPVSSPNAILGSTYNNVFFSTYNDVDYAAEVVTNDNGFIGFEIVPGASLSGLYVLNPSASTINSTGGTNVYDVENQAGYGIRAGGNTTVHGLRFNTPQTNTTYIYNGVPAWDINLPSGRTLTLNSILITTNAGTSPVLVNNGAFSGGTIGFFRAGGGQDLLIYQNNTAAPLIIMPNTEINQQSAGSSLIKLGAGTMQVQSPLGSYSGTTRVYEGTLELDSQSGLGLGPLNVYGGAFAQASGSLNVAPTTVSSGATDNVLINTANGQAINSTNLTFNAGSTLQFIYGNTISPSATVPALVISNTAAGLTLNSPVSLTVLCGSFSMGQFPLIKYGNPAASNGFAALSLTLPPHIFGYLSNNTANSSYDLVLTNVDQPLAWNAGSGVWDIGQTANWRDALGNTTTYQQLGGLGDDVLFGDAAPGPSPITVTLNVSPTPGSVAVNNVNNTYIISGTGNISGAGSLTKTGSGSLTLSTVNSFSGGINLNGGSVLFGALPNLGAGAIAFSGGILQYTGNTDDISVRTVAFNAGGGTINDDGASIVYANPIGNNGAGGLTKAGSGTLTLNGTNTYAGNTMVSQGTLALGSANTFVNNSAGIIVNGGASFSANGLGGDFVLSPASGQILAGAGSVVNTNGTVWATNNTAVSPATNGVYGTLSIGNNFAVSGGTLIMDVSVTNSDLILVTSNLTLTSGTLQLLVQGTLTNGVYPLIRYAGTLTGDPANLAISGFSSVNQFATLGSARPGEIDLILVLGGNANLVWSGSGSGAWDINVTADWLSNGVASVFLNGDAVTLDDTSSNPNVALQTNVGPRSITVNATNNNYNFTDGTLAGNGLVFGSGGITVNSSSANITTFATANNNTGPTVINGGTLQIGNGLLGNLGIGNVTNNGTLSFNQGSGLAHTLSQISGAGSLVQEGSDPVILGANNSYTGPTTIQSGTLQVGNGGAAGTLGSGAVTNNGLLIINRSGTYTLANGITGSGELAISGPGTVTLGGVNSYSGITSISNGVVKLAAAQEIPSTSELEIDGGATAGTLNLAGFNETINSLTGAAGTLNSVITNSGTSATVTNTLTILNGNGTTYNGIIADNSSGSKTLLDLVGNGSLQLNAVNTWSGGSIVGNGATLAVGAGAILGAGGILLSNGATLGMPTTTGVSPTIGNTITTMNGAVAYLTSGSLANTISGQFIGSTSTTNWFNGNISVSGTTPFANFLGTVVISNNVGGDPVRLSQGTGAISGGNNTTFDIEGGALVTRNAATVLVGNLIGSSGGIYAPTVAVPGTYIIGGLNLSSVFPGTITGSNNLVKTGTGTLTLNGLAITTNTDNATYTNLLYTNLVNYIGTTTISNGVLALVVPDDFSNSTIITLDAATAVLDASQMGYVSNFYDYTQSPPAPTNSFLVTNGVMELYTNQALAGIGTIRGSLMTDAGSTFTVGLPLGPLNVTGNVNVAGAVTMAINRTNAPNSSELVAGNVAATAATATLVITNVGPSMNGGEVFHLFSTAVSGFTDGNLTLPPLSNPLSWTNKLAIDGTIDVLGSLVNTNATNITFVVNNDILNLSWPPDHVGWRLLVQTGHLSQGVSTLASDWMTVAGSSATNQETVPISAANRSEFYKLVYP